jgi:transcription termination/antitermination protein NusG
MNWYAVYVKPRHEFVTQGELYKKNIETFLPTFKSMRLWRDRKKWLDFPLFPGYLFVNIAPHPENYLFISKTKGVINIVSSSPGHPVSAASEEIDSLRIVIESGIKFDVYPTLVEGTRIKIAKGPLKGAEGVITKKLDQYMLQVNIEILGRSVSVDISGDHIERASSELIIR